MHRLIHCPMCGNKLKNKNYKTIKQKSCPGTAHYFSIILKDNKVMTLLLCLDNYSSITIDYVNQKSTYQYDSLDVSKTIVIPKILEMDFPKLQKLKEKLSTYVLFT